MSETGTVMFWKEREGSHPFGFILPDGVSPDDRAGHCYFNPHALIDSYDSPKKNERVSFEYRPKQEGRGLSAKAVKNLESENVH